MTAREKMQAARTALVLDQPFFGVLALRLRLVEDPHCPTAWTDGTALGYNPEFIDKLSHDELLGVVAHEVLHCANGHPWRRDSRENFKWNVACDYAINYVLEDVGFKLPKGCLRAKKFDGKASEWIYDRLPPTVKIKVGSMPGTGAPDVRNAPGGGAGGGGGADGDGTTEADWQQAVQQAAVAAKATGDLPATLDRFAKHAAQPRVDWRSVLRRFVQQAATSDYAWTRPSVRHLAHGLYLPALRSEAMGPIAVAVDTSGSIDDVTLSQFAAELNSVVDETRPARTYVLYCDAQVHRVDTFERDEQIVMNPVGGGGTCFAPIMDAVDEFDEEPVCLIVLTDLQGGHREKPPAMPVLWATIYPGEAPYGEIVSLER